MNDQIIDLIQERDGLRNATILKDWADSHSINFVNRSYDQYTTRTVSYDVLIDLVSRSALNQSVTRCKCCGYLVTESEHKGCLRAAEVEIPAGYQLAPIEPTNKMIKEAWAMLEENVLPLSQRDKIICAYKAMLAAAKGLKE